MSVSISFSLLVCVILVSISISLSSLILTLLVYMSGRLSVIFTLCLCGCRFSFLSSYASFCLFPYYADLHVSLFVSSLCTLNVCICYWVCLLAVGVCLPLNVTLYSFSSSYALNPKVPESCVSLINISH